MAEEQNPEMNDQDLTELDPFNQLLINEVEAKFGDKVGDFELPYGLLTFYCTRDVVVDLLQFLFDHEELSFQFMTDLCAVHYPDQEDAEICVVYHLHNLVKNKRVRIKTFAPISDPVVPTATTVFKTANWMERETYDFYGVLFTGHPNLKRILNVDDMDYFPLRKEYPLEDPTRQDKHDAMFGR